MRIVTCASYYGTGSSAVTDYIGEFESVASLGDYEFRFLHDPDGVADLEYNLVWNHNRHNSGHAIKRFKRLVDFNAGTKLIKRYEPFFSYNWKKIAYRYIDSLVDFSYKGWWQYDLLDKGTNYYYRKLLINKAYKLTLGRNKERTLNVLPNEITYCGRPTQEEFDAKTKVFLRELFEAANVNDKPYLMVDQLLPASNLSRFRKYFDDLRVIVVERDPRDLYILEKYIWKATIIPTESVEVFCQWYKYTRAHRKTELFDPEYVMFVQFEDLIYHYENTTAQIRDWIGLDETDHKVKFQRFDPSKSIKNTKLWEVYDAHSEIKVIETELSEYLYRYSGSSNGRVTQDENS